MLRTPTEEPRRSALPEEPAALAHLCEAFVAERDLDEAQRCFDDATALPAADEALRVRGVETALLRRDGAGAKARLSPLLGRKNFGHRFIAL